MSAALLLSCSQKDMTADYDDVIPQPQEISLIPLDHTARQIIARGRHKRIQHKRERRDQARRWLIGIASASLAINMVQSVIIYILQAGPI